MFVWFSTNLYAEESKHGGNYVTNSGKCYSHSGKRQRKEVLLLKHLKDKEYIHSKRQAKTTSQNTKLHNLTPKTSDKLLHGLLMSA
jgi:hypothetical protein